MSLLNNPPILPVVDANGNAAPGWANFFSSVAQIVTAMTQSGTTAQRPTVFLWTGRMFYDTTLALPVFYKGPGWIKADGTPA